MPQITARCTSGDVIPVAVENTGQLKVAIYGEDISTGAPTLIRSSEFGTLDTSVQGYDADGAQYVDLEVDHVAGTAWTYGPLNTLDNAHHQLHYGKMFSAYQLSAGVTDGSAINIYLKTPVSSAGWVHIQARWSAGGAAYFTIYEGPTITANTGTASAARCKNRYYNSGSGILDNEAVPVSACYSVNVTKTADGTILVREHVGTYTTNIGQSDRNSDEWVLNPNTVYLFEVESDIVQGSGVMGLVLTWYEHITSLPV